MEACVHAVSADPSWNRLRILHMYLTLRKGKKSPLNIQHSLMIGVSKDLFLKGLCIFLDSEESGQFALQRPQHGSCKICLDANINSLGCYACLSVVLFMIFNRMWKMGVKAPSLAYSRATMRFKCGRSQISSSVDI